MSKERQKRIAVINDFSGFGRCSIAVSLPIISAMKIQCCPLPTSIFSNHTGYDSYFYTDYTEHMDAYINEWIKLSLEFDGILTGYLGSPEQIDIVSGFLKQFKTHKNVTVIDPVMGDNGKLYSAYSPKLADKMKQLLPYADILTPNLTEACILTGTDYRREFSSEKLADICKTLAQTGPQKIVISGLERGDDLENFIYDSGSITTVREHKAGACRAGTGDVFSSIIVADAVNGCALSQSVSHASHFIAKALKRTAELDIPSADGICFEEFLKEI